MPRKLLRPFVVTMLAAGAGWLTSAWVYNCTQPYNQLPQVSVSLELATQAQTKLAALATAKETAMRIGRRIPVRETFNDGELSSFANDNVGQRGGTLNHIVLHATNRGTIEITADGHFAGVTFPLYMDGRVSVVGENQPAYSIATSKIGRNDMPTPLVQRLNDWAASSIIFDQFLPLSDLKIAVANGTVTISGLAEPACCHAP